MISIVLFCQSAGLSLGTLLIEPVCLFLGQLPLGPGGRGRNSQSAFSGNFTEYDKDWMLSAIIFFLNLAIIKKPTKRKEKG